MNSHSMSIGQYLKDLREQKNLSLKDVVALSEGYLDKTTLSRIENNRRHLNIRAAYALSKIYQVSIAELAEVYLGKASRDAAPPIRLSALEHALIELYRTLPQANRDTIVEITRAFSARNYPQPMSGGNLAEECFAALAGI